MNAKWEAADLVAFEGRQLVKAVAKDGWPTVGVVDFDKPAVTVHGDIVRYEYKLHVDQTMSRAEREDWEGGAA